MPDNMKNIADSIQAILDKNKGFVALSQLPKLMSAELRDKLGIKRNASVKILMKIKRFAELLDENFVLRKKGNAQYILTPCDPAELVLSVLSENTPIAIKVIAAKLKPFTNSDIAAILTELENSRQVKIIFDDKFTAKVLLAGNTAHDATPACEYTHEEFRDAFNELEEGRVFVKICDLRRKLNWPRDVFDDMLKDLRDREIIQMHIGDEHLMTPDEVKDSFVNELNYLMGTVTWNVR